MNTALDTEHYITRKLGSGGGCHMGELKDEFYIFERVNPKVVRMRIATKDDNPESTYMTRPYPGNYHRPNTKSREITIPSYICDEMSWKRGKTLLAIAQTETGDKLLTEAGTADVKQYEESTYYLHHMAEGRVGDRRHLYLTPEQKEILHIPTNIESWRRVNGRFYIKITVDVTENKAWMCVEPIADEAEEQRLMSLKQAIKEYGKSLYKSVFSYKYDFYGNINLPAPFIRKSGIDGKVSYLGSITRENSLIFFARRDGDACVFCGHEGDGISGLNGQYDFDVDCDAVIPQAAMRIANASGDIVEALRNVQNELTQAKAVVDAALPGHPVTRKKGPVVTKKTWTPERVEILKRVFPISGIEGVKKALPGMTETGIITRAKAEGLITNNNWSEAEDDIVRQYWETEGSMLYKRLPGRTRASVYNRARKLGLSHKSIQRTTTKSSGTARKVSDFVDEDSLFGPITLGSDNNDRKEEN